MLGMALVGVLALVVHRHNPIVIALAAGLSAITLVEVVIWLIRLNDAIRLLVE